VSAAAAAGASTAWAAAVAAIILSNVHDHSIIIAAKSSAHEVLSVFNLR